MIPQRLEGPFSSFRVACASTGSSGAPAQNLSPVDVAAENKELESRPLLADSFGQSHAAAPELGAGLSRTAALASSPIQPTAGHRVVATSPQSGSPGASQEAFALEPSGSSCVLRAAETAAADKEHDATSPSTMLEAPSSGSAGHPHLCNAPCSWNAYSGCSRGAGCDLCHLPHRKTLLQKLDRSTFQELPASVKIDLLTAVLGQRLRTLGFEAEAARLWEASGQEPEALSARTVELKADREGMCKKRVHRLAHSLLSTGLIDLTRAINVLARGSSLSQAATSILKDLRHTTPRDEGN